MLLKLTDRMNIFGEAQSQEWISSLLVLSLNISKYEYIRVELFEYSLRSGCRCYAVGAMLLKLTNWPNEYLNIFGEAKSQEWISSLLVLSLNISEYEYIRVELFEYLLRSGCRCYAVRATLLELWLKKCKLPYVCTYVVIIWFLCSWSALAMLLLCC